MLHRKCYLFKGVPKHKEFHTDMSKIKTLKLSGTQIRTICLLGAQLSGSLCLSSPTNAQVPTQVNDSHTLWDSLRKAQSRITACHVSWKSTLTIKPKTGVDPKKRAAQTLAWAQKQGFSNEEAREQAERERREATRDIKGRTIVTVFDFKRVGDSVRCDIVRPDLQVHTVEFFDGTNALSTITEGIKDRGTSNANLTRNPQEILKLSAFGEQTARLLLGIPIDEEFSPSNPALSPQNTILKIGLDNTLLLERKPELVIPRTGMPDMLTISLKHGGPISYEVFEKLIFTAKNGQDSVKKGKPIKSVRVEGYQQYKNNIWFPSKITITSPTLTQQYSLMEATFNEEVDPMELRLPPMRVADARFGYGPKLAIYKLKNGVIPSDEDVKRMINRDKEAKQAQETTSKNAGKSDSKSLSSLPLAPAAGLMFMAMGCMMWVRSREL